LRENRGRTSRAELDYRQDLELRYYLGKLTPLEMQASLREGHGLSVSLRTIYRDFRALREMSMKRVEASQLYSLRIAYLELEEAQRELYRILHARPRPLKDAEGNVMVDNAGNPIFPDDRGIKLACINTWVSIVDRKARLAGFYSKKYAETITVFENASDQRLKYEIVPIEDLLDAGERELEKGERLRRAEGLEESDD
jgi:hypothetical protein